MKITAIQATPLAIPLRHETPVSAWTAGLGKQIIIQVFTDAGIVGLGESFAYGVPLAVCAVIDPTVITTHFIPVDVETGGELSQGRTVADFRGRSKRPPNVHFAMDADEPKFVAMLLEILGRTL